MDSTMENVQAEEQTSVVAVVAVAAVVAMSVYAVRRGIDRRVARQIRKHLKKEK